MADKAPNSEPDTNVIQGWVDEQAADQPAYKKRMIDTLNKQGAEERSHLVLRLPQPSPIAHCVFTELKWTPEEAERYLKDGILPRDLSSASQDGKCILLWLFDASHTCGKLPELELDPVPGFKKHPALCAFDVDGKDNVALIPSEDLEVIPTRGGKYRFVLTKQRGDEAD